jgi:sensor histidine kinase YesM
MLKPVHVIVFFTLFFTINTFSDHWDYYYSHSLLQSIAWTCLIGMRWGLLAWVDYRIIDYAQTKYPAVNRLWRRVLFSYPLMVFTCYVFIFLFDFIGVLFIFKEQIRVTEFSLTFNLVGSLIISIIILPAFEMLFANKVSNRIAVENLELKRRNLQGQYDVLKGQVNPHFLFNSLNSLAWLIKKNPQQATVFVDEMAYVYRYLLKSNEHNKVTLKEELKFVKAYFQLLQTRFDSGIQLEIDLPEQEEEIYIVPLTLQILMENVVKHNIISVEAPIFIQMTYKNGCFVIENNIRKKNYAVDSTKTGLSNIASKYKLLGAPEIEVNESPERFLVKIPILW